MKDMTKEDCQTFHWLAIIPFFSLPFSSVYLPLQRIQRILFLNLVLEFVIPNRQQNERKASS